MVFTKGKGNKKLGTQSPPKVSLCCNTNSGSVRKTIIYSDGKTLTKRVIISSPCQTC